MGSGLIQQTRFFLVVAFLSVELLGAPHVVVADELAEESPGSKFTRVQKTTALNIGAGAIIIGWGVLNWDYFAQSPRADNEGWFGRNTDEGGADKVGHAFAAYAMSHGFSTIYRNWNYSRQEAALYGAWSAFGMTTLMELGDSFSDDYGFSYEDQLMNVAGVAMGYLLDSYPSAAKKINFRWEYNPNLGDPEGDFVTDYEHSRYLLALKANGFDKITNPIFKALELHVGYYTRGYDDYSSVVPDERKRTVYGGIGVNIGYLLEPLWKTRLFDYYQPPYTHLDLEFHD